jgi:hypothetical protein
VTTPELHTVRFVRFPLPLFSRARQHGEALLREFAIMAAGVTPPDVPKRLIELVRSLEARYGGLNAETEELVERALTRGDNEVDFEIRVPPEMSQVAKELRGMLDEADEYCRRGDLLTLATVDEQRDLRNWYLDEVVRQLDGKAPTPWPEWKAS